MGTIGSNSITTQRLEPSIQGMQLRATVQLAYLLHHRISPHRHTSFHG
jgi:hypothetical protein